MVNENAMVVMVEVKQRDLAVESVDLCRRETQAEWWWQVQAGGRWYPETHPGAGIPEKPPVEQQSENGTHPVHLPGPRAGRETQV